MLVTENRDTNEVSRFFVIDAFARLGSIQVGSDIRMFDPQRILRYYALVENQLFDLSARYPESFKFLPRRAYSYLSKPPILSEIVSSSSPHSGYSWLADQIVIQPLTDISSRDLPKYQSRSNVETCNRWSTESEFASRLFQVSNLSYNVRKDEWAVSIDGKYLPFLNSPKLHAEIIDRIKQQQLVYVRLIHQKEIEVLLEWLVTLKEAGVKDPNLLLSVVNHDGWENHLSKLLQMDGVHLLTSGSTIMSMSSLIRELREQNEDDWSKKLVFGSAYPETQQGDSITEILSLLLSRNLDASKTDIQRIMAANILRLLAPPIDGKAGSKVASVVAENILGKPALNEFLRVIRFMSTGRQIAIKSVEVPALSAHGLFEYNSLILTVKNLKSGQSNRALLLRERDETLRVIGWQTSFNEHYKARDWETLFTHARMAAKGPVLDSIAHLPQFSRIVLEILSAHDAPSVLSSLHYQITLGKIAPGKVGICPNDAELLGIDEGDIIEILDSNSIHIWGAIAEYAKECPSKSVVLSKKDFDIFGLGEESQLDIVKYDEPLVECQRIVLTYDRNPGFVASEIYASLYLSFEEIKEALSDRIIGVGTRLVTSKGIEVIVNQTKPALRKGQLCRCDETSFDVISSQFLNEMNVIIAIPTGTEMLKDDIEFIGISTVRNMLSAFSMDVPECSTFLNSIDRMASRLEVASVSALDILRCLRHNESEGVIGVLFADSVPSKFSIQRNDRLEEFIRFDSDIRNDDIFNTLVYSILDARETSGEQTDPNAIFRGLAEMLEDLGDERPTLGIVFLSDLDEEIMPFIKALKTMQNYKLLVVGLGSEFDTRRAQSLFDGMNVEVHHIMEFSIFRLHNILDTSIQELCHS